jgi:hypothetical protein
MKASIAVKVNLDVAKAISALTKLTLAIGGLVKILL